MERGLEHPKIRGPAPFHPLTASPSTPPPWGGSPPLPKEPPPGPASAQAPALMPNRDPQDPVVQRMQEKFGAEIRTVIDYRDKQ